MFCLKLKAQAVIFPWPLAVSKKQSSCASKLWDRHLETRQTGKEGLRGASEMQNHNMPRDRESLCQLLSYLKKSILNPNMLVCINWRKDYPPSWKGSSPPWTQEQQNQKYFCSFGYLPLFYLNTCYRQDCDYHDL